jgi:hypothetical protein
MVKSGQRNPGTGEGLQERIGSSFQVDITNTEGIGSLRAQLEATKGEPV